MTFGAAMGRNLDQDQKEKTDIVIDQKSDLEDIIV